MKCSIITAALNRSAFVERAISSVVEQGVADVEHLIIDGGSSDGSLEIYRRHPHLIVSVEKDENVYDAFNKGIALASGDIIGILNTDDVYRPQVLRTVLKVFEEEPELEVVSGGCVYQKQSKSNVEPVAWYAVSEFLKLDPELLLRQPPLVNGRFFRKQVFERLGGFEIAFPVVADREFMIRCALAGLRNRVVESVFCEYTLHEGALSHKPDGVGTMVLKENYSCAVACQRNSPNSFHRKIYGSWAAWSALLLTLDSIRRHAYVSGIQLLLKHAPRWLRYFPSMIRMMVSQRRQQKQYRCRVSDGMEG